MADNVTGEAAKVAYYFFLSLFPLVLVLFALTGLLGGDAAFAWIMDRVRGTLPVDAARLIESAVAEITSEARPGILSVGIALTLWAASNVYAALGDGLAILLLLGTAALMILGAILVLAGREIGGILGLGAAWSLVRGPLAFGLIATVLALVYFVLPNRDQRQSKGPILAGAVVGALLWILATVIFRLYVANFGNYSDTYGFVGAVIVLLLWLYLTALSVLVGGEVAWAVETHRDEARTRRKDVWRDGGGVDRMRGG